MPTKRGYSLMEAVVYITILATIAVFTVNTILITTKAFAAARNLRNVHASAEAALERITREIRFAENVNTASSVFDINPGVLTLVSIDPTTEAPQTITLALTNNAVTIQKGSGIPEDLTSGRASVTNLIFRHLVSAGTTSEAVKVELEVNSKKFYDTIILRRSY